MEIRATKVYTPALFNASVSAVNATSTALGRAPTVAVKFKWMSGAESNQNLSSLTAFETYRGLDASHHVVYPSRDSWPAMLNNWWVLRNRPAQRLSVATPLWPTGATVSENHNAEWTQFAGLLQAGDVIRLGWECNLPNAWHIDSSNRVAWRAAWIRAYNTIKAANPGILIELCLNEGQSQNDVPNDVIVSDLTGYFDLFGCDMYWWFGVTDTESSWTTRINRTHGLNWFLSTAQSLGKKMTITEWGIASIANNGTGDTAFYVNHLFAWLAQNAQSIYSECYFNDLSAGYLVPTTQNPVAAAAYQAAVNTYLIQ